jgi:DNA-binding transcriptional LysR family regulator
MNLDQLNGLLALKAIADTRNFTKAARIFGVTPSAVSQTIKQLEQRVGVALLSRTTRNTTLTEAGEKFLNQAGPALDQVLSALENVGAYAKQPSGLLRINLPRQVFSFYLAPMFVSFMEKHPEITLDLVFDDQQTDIIEKGCDAGIRLSDILAKDVVAIKLFGPVRFVTAASPKYLNRAGRPEHPKDLLSHNCIRPYCFHESIYDKWEFENKGKDFQVQVKGSLILNDTSMMLDAAIKGAGIIYTTEAVIEDEVRAGELEIVLKRYACTSTGFYLYYPTRSQVLPKLRAFIDHVKSEIKAAKEQQQAT